MDGALVEQYEDTLKCEREYFVKNIGVSRKSNEE